MRIVKPLIVFLLIAGNIVLLLNIDNIFGSKHSPTPELTEAQKEEIFNEMLAKKIGPYSVKEEPKAEKTFPFVEPVTDEKTIKDKVPVHDSIKEENKKQHSEDSLIAKRSKTAKDEGNEKTVKSSIKNPEKEIARAELLELVKEKKYNEFLKHKQMKDVLSMEERVAVENVLDYTNKNFKKDFKNKNRYNSRILKYMIKSEVYEKVFDGREITWDLLLNASRAIQKMIINLDNGYDIMHGVHPL